MDLLENKKEINPDQHWYYKEKFFHIHRAIEKYQPEFSSICDVGAGTAPFLKKLVRIYPSKKYQACDINYSKDFTTNHKDHITYSKKIQIADVYLVTDVIEHLLNPRITLVEIKNICLDGAIVIVTVPAHKILWSGHDEFLKHYRRYSKRTLKNDLSSLEGQVMEMYYIFNLLFFPAFLTKLFNRKIESKMKNFGNIASLIIYLTLKIERFLKNKIPFGISLFAVVKLP